MLISIALASGLMLLWPVMQGASEIGLDPTGAVQLINREKAVVVDVCEPSEFAAGHIGGAKNIPLANWRPSPCGRHQEQGCSADRWCALRERVRVGRWPLPETGIRRTRCSPVAVAWPGALRTCLSRKAETMQKVTMYTTAVCPYCVQTKRVLHAKGVTDIDEIRVDADPGQRAKMMEITGRRTVPQIFIGSACRRLRRSDGPRQPRGLLPLLNAA